MLYAAVVLNILNNGEVYCLKASELGGLNFIEHRVVLLNENYLHVGHRQYFFPQCAQIQTLLHSWQLLICGYPRDSSYKVCVYLLLLSQDMICCSEHGPPFVCKCVTLKITISPIARKREKSIKKKLKRILDNYPQLSWQGWAAALVLSVAEAGCSPVWLLQLEFISSNLKHHLATEQSLRLNKSPSDLFPAYKAQFIISP